MGNVRPRLKPTRKLICVISTFLIILTFILYIFYNTHNHGAITDKYIMGSTYDPSEIFIGEKYVHLDLKGAPPKISYYEELFPFLAKLGATGLLIEYEDMFPYSGDILENISANNAYTLTDINKINCLAERNNLSVIPLVQTFGHLEFLLKLNNYSYLREVPQYPQTICPTNNMSLVVINEIISQVVLAHPKSTMIHIGADEVYHIGLCDRCVKTMASQKITKSQLFLSHVMNVVKYIRKNHPHLNILMWDDEFRGMSLEELRRSTVNRFVEPVVWKYKTAVMNDLGYSLFNTYAELFPNLWIASAFKGATSSKQYLTPIPHHTLNHQSWMQVYNEYKSEIHFKGIFLTGWQRYDHFAVLCELLPVSIPSLVMSFGILMGYNNKYFTPPNELLKLLSCENPRALLDFKSGLPYCSFPGAQIFDLMLQFHQITEEYSELLEDSRVKGWIGNYNVNHNYSNPDHVNSILPSLHNIVSQLFHLDSSLSKTLLEVYDNYTVSEWTETYFKPLFDDTKSLVESTNKLLALHSWPRRPF